MHHSQFVHLHVHSYYSLLDGAISIDKLAEKSKEYKLPAVALTDHGNLFGGVEFYKRLSSEGVKPIIGTEAYLLTKGSRRDKTVRKDGSFLSHLVLLVKNLKGYQNLCRLISSSYLDGFYYKPRIDKEILEEFNEGLIVLGGCLKGEVANLLLEGRAEDAEAAARWYQNLFKDRYYLELMDHGLEGQLKVNPQLIDLGKKLGIPYVATNDCHYVEATDVAAHEALLCIQTGKTLLDPDRMVFSSDKFYIRSPLEMQELFAHVPEALSATMDIAARCNFEFDFKTYHFPKFQPPEGKDLPTFLSEKTSEGFAKRLDQLKFFHKDEFDKQLPQYHERIAGELEMIKKMGFSGYFLIVADFIEEAKKMGVSVGPGRGSAAGSLVAYALGITDVDPIPYKLLFERFLNPERVSMPDMDIDFCVRNRDRVIDYVTKKYGNVSQIITFGKMRARAVIRDVGRVMGMPYGDVDRIAKLIPATLDITLDKALQVEPQLKELVEKDAQVERLYDIARKLEGFPRHASTHAAGVVISDQPLMNFLPLYKGQKDEVVTQFDMKCVESIGLIKFDFLGLKTLTLIEDALKIIKKTRGLDVNIETIPLDDKSVYDLLSGGDTKGVFQLESSGMTDLIMRLKPASFEEITALVALFRPGPLGSGMVDDFIDRKHGRHEIVYELPQLEQVLKDTFGVILYQEQVMQIASKLANFTLGDADLLRRAMGKKKPEEMAKQREKFLKGAAENHLPAAKAERIFDLMAEFAGYGFNKCVVAETELVDADTGELFTIGDLIKERAHRRTLSCNSAHRLLPKKITDHVSNGRKKVFRLSTHLGHEITATANHPFLTLGGWKTLEDLSVGDRIATPRKIPIHGKNKMPRHELITMALLIAEGNLCHPSSLYFYNNDRAMIDDFVENVTKFKRTNARIDQRRAGIFEVCVNTGSQSQSVCGAYLWAKKQGLTGKKAAEKEIPASIFGLQNKQIALFLGRLWSGDGFIFGNNNTLPFYASASHRLVKQVQHLLLRFEIVSRLAKKSFKYKGTIKTGYALYLTGENASNKFLKAIGPFIVGRKKALGALKKYLRCKGVGTGCRDTIPWEVKYLVRDRKLSSGKTWLDIERETDLSMKEFYGGKHDIKRGFRRETILALGKYFRSKELVDIATSDIYWDEIKDIKAAGTRETYDITVQDDHNFVANGIIVHNSHSAAYALVAYRTAYLKTHYLTEFMAALLTSETGNTDKILEYMNDCKEHNIKMLPPDINESTIDFAVVGDKTVRFGMGAVKNVGEAAIDAIVQSRESGERFKSLVDVCEKVDLRRVNKRVIESLIKCGAMDSFGEGRAFLFSQLDGAMEYGSKRQKDRDSGQGSIFDLMPMEDGDHVMAMQQPSMILEWSEHQILSFEKEALGFYLTGHPLAQYEGLVKQYTKDTIKLISELKTRRDVRFAGVVAGMREILTKKGDKMAFVVLEDLTATIEAIVFSDVFLKSNIHLKGDLPLFFTGTSEVDEENVRVIVKEIFPVAELPTKLTKSVHFHLSAVETDEKQLAQLKAVLSRYPGTCPGFVHLSIPEKSETVLALPAKLSLAPTIELVKSLEKLFGHNVTRFEGREVESSPKSMVRGRGDARNNKYAKE